MLENSTFETITVVQGEYRISDNPKHMLSTILGSCVAVCLYDTNMKIGGMNHFLLPGSIDSSGGNIKYGAHAMELLINDLLKKGAARNDLRAKIFGGATMSKSLGSIGESNGSFADSFLKREGIPCVSSSLGGFSARRIKFHPVSGDAKQLLVKGEAESETDLIRSYAPRPAAQDITLF